MKLFLTVAFIAALNPISSFAGRATPKGISIDQFTAVLGTLEVKSRALNIRTEKDLHYIIEYQNSGEDNCIAKGYDLRLKEEDPRTAKRIYSATFDGMKRRCVVDE